MILLSVLLLSVTLEPPSAPPTPSYFEEYIKPVFHTLIDSVLYFGAGTVCGSAALVFGAGGSLCQPFTKMSKIGDECFLASQILGIATVNFVSVVPVLKLNGLERTFVNDLVPKALTEEESAGVEEEGP